MTERVLDYRADATSEERVSALLDVLARVVRSISRNHEATIQPVDGILTGATDGRSVLVESGLLRAAAEDHSLRGLARLRGLIYHELSHLLWTDFDQLNASGTDWYIQQWSRRFKDAWNILEDQRIEALLAVRHPDTIPYLNITVLDLVVGSPESAHPYVHGRRYLDPAVRRTAWSAWTRSDPAEVAAVIDEYVTLNPVESPARALELIDRLRVLIEDAPDEVGGLDDHADDSSGSSSSEATDEEQDEVEQRVAGDPGGPSDDADEIGESEDDAEGGGSGEDDEEADDDSTGSGGGGSDAEADDTEEDADADPDAEGVDQTPGEQARDAIERALEDLLTSDEVQSGVNSDLREIDKALRNAAVTPSTERAHSKTFNLPAGASALPQKIVQEVTRAARRFAPGIVRRQATGELNVLDYRSRRPGDNFNVFDRYQRNRKNAAAIEAVVLLDTSGSTADATASRLYGQPGTVADTNALVSWAIKRAFDQLPYSTAHVGVFNNGFQGWLYSGSESAERSQYRYTVPGGGTSPEGAILEAAKTFDRSDARTKLLIIVTDGAWWGGSGDDLIERAREAGVVTVLVGVGGAQDALLPVEQFGAHGAEIARDFHEPSDLVKTVRDLATSKLNEVADQLALER